MEGGFVKRQTVDGGPEVQDVALGGAIGLETVEEIFTQLDRTGIFLDGHGGRRFGMDRTGTTPLLSFASGQAQDAQVLEYLFHGDLLAQEGEIHFGSFSRRC